MELVRPQEDSAPTPQQKVYPSTLPKTRKALTRLLNEFLQDPQADTARFRATIYALKTVLEAHRAEKDAELEARIVALEAAQEKKA